MICCDRTGNIKLQRSTVWRQSQLQNKKLISVYEKTFFLFIADAVKLALRTIIVSFHALINPRLSIGR